MAKMPKKVLVTFDIDGNLLKNTRHPSIQLHRQALYYDLAFQNLPKLKQCMLDYAKLCPEDIAKGLEICPGVSSLLQHLSDNKDVCIGLVTGEIEDLAWMKMEGMGIHKYFTEPNVGGFGSDHMELGDLVLIAKDRARKLYPDEPFDLRVHVGDTPNHIHAAEYGGALAVGVCTGGFREEDLMQASDGSAVILPDLTDAKAFMNLLGI